MGSGVILTPETPSQLPHWITSKSGGPKYLALHTLYTHTVLTDAEKQCVVGRPLANSLGRHISPRCFVVERGIVLAASCYLSLT